MTLLGGGHRLDVRRHRLEVGLDPGADVVQLPDAERRDHLRPAGAAGGAVEAPLLRRERLERHRLDVDRGVRVRDQEVAVDEHRVAPLVGKMERELGVLDGLDDVHGRQHDVAVVAVTAAPGGLEVVALATRHVEDHHRQPCERGLGERLLHEREPLPDGAGRGARAGAQRAPAHPDRLELALGVDAHPAHFGKALGEGLEQLGERRHRIPGEEPAARGDRGLGHRLRPFHQTATAHAVRSRFRSRCIVSSSSIGSS